MMYEFQVRMQQRQLKAIVGALRFRQRLLSGDVYGTIGRAAMDAWGTFLSFSTRRGTGVIVLCGPLSQVSR